MEFVQPLEFRAAADRLRAWREEPLAFVHDNWPGFKAEPWQEEFWRECVRPGREKRISLQACAGVGKSCGLAIEGLRRLAAYAKPGEHPKGAAVSMTRDNLADNLWAELAKWLRTGRMIKDEFVWTSERIYQKDNQSTWFLSARGWSKRANPEEQGRTLSGLHSLFPFVLMDESATIPLSVAQTAEQILTTCEDGMIVQAGNPTTQEGCLYDASVKQRGRWYVIEITADPDDPNRCGRVSEDWARAQIYGDKTTDPPTLGKGRDDPWVQAFILGQFPKGGINQLLSLEEVNAAMNRALKKSDFDFAPKVLGLDVARQGLDASVLIARQGKMVYKPDVYRGLSGLELAAKVAGKIKSFDADATFIDDTGGWGGSVLERLRELQYDPIGVQYAGKPIDPGFGNKRAEMWWNAAQAVKNGAALPDIPELRDDLVTPLYFYKGDKLFLESKDDIRGRLGRSPDYGDAFAQTYALPVNVRPEKTNPMIPWIKADLSPMGATRFDNHQMDDDDW
jgi:hypothetical protein